MCASDPRRRGAELITDWPAPRHALDHPNVSSLRSARFRIPAELVLNPYSLFGFGTERQCPEMKENIKSMVGSCDYCQH
jgi:hypothetical protein